MSLLLIVLVSAVVLSIAYWTYGPLLVRLFGLDARRPTPSVELRDDVDYVPIESKFLLSQHFSAIAAAGPIVGPILAGAAWGWAPALAWILVGSILIGGTHDFTALVASIRHKARSIAEVVRDHMSQRSYILFLTFVWLALVYIIVAFTDITASTFVGKQVLESGEEVSGGGIATSSILYLLLGISMGVVLRYTRVSLSMATAIFLPLVGLAIWGGQHMSLDLAGMLDVSDRDATKIWGVILLIYCFGASITPMWLLLQPRGHLGGYFLYVALAAGGLGVTVGALMGGAPLAFPAFRGWTSAAGQPLVPMLFITIACGACSGFHSLIASGTTSKQLRVETDAKLIGYGAMLLEAMVAIISLSCVMILAVDHPLMKSPSPNYIYARGIGSLMEVFGLPQALVVSFALMAFTTFIYDTLDVCTRLGRYIIQELSGWQDARGRWLGTALTAGVPLFFLLRSPPPGPDGKVIPVWQAFWNLFGASNQLLAALTLLGVTVWIWRTRRVMWIWLVTGVPMVLMYVMSTWALTRIIRDSWWPASQQGQFVFRFDAVPSVAVVLIVLALLMLVEAALAIAGANRDTRPPESQGVLSS